MAIFFDAPVEPDALTTYVRNVPLNASMRLQQMFPSRVHVNNTVNFAEIVRTNRTARYRSYDGRIHVSERDSGSEKLVKLAPLSSSLSLGEYERLQLEFAKTAGTNIQALAASIYDDATTLTREVQNRWEQAWGDVLTDGKLTINEEGFQSEADYGIPTGVTAATPGGSQVITAGTPWTTTATADILTDLITWNDVYIANNGFAPANFLTSQRVMRLFQTNVKIINSIKGSAAGVSRVNATEVVDLLSSNGLPTPLPPYDAQVDIDGTSTRVTADDKVMFFPPNIGDLGHNAVGVSATALELVNAAQSDLSFADASGIVGVVIKSGPPFRQWVYVDAVGMPVLDNAKLLMVADVI
jgi:hypothetical protein